MVILFFFLKAKRTSEIKKKKNEQSDTGWFGGWFGGGKKKSIPTETSADVSNPFGMNFHTVIFLLLFLTKCLFINKKKEEDVKLIKIIYTVLIKPCS